MNRPNVIPFSRKLDPDELARIYADTDADYGPPYLTFGDIGRYLVRLAVAIVFIYALLTAALVVLS